MSQQTELANLLDRQAASDVMTDYARSIDDKDLLGVFVQARPHYLGFGRKDTVERKQGCWDVVLYEAVKSSASLDIWASISGVMV